MVYIMKKLLKQICKCKSFGNELFKNILLKNEIKYQ